MPHQNPLLPALAPASGGALTTATGPQRIATRMAENLLSMARSQERALAAQRRYRIGDYEFREADHAQIQRWARRLGMVPEAVVEGLTDREFCVKDGAIISLMRDFESFPLTDWEWGAGLKIKSLCIKNAPKSPLPTLPECLHKLNCSFNQLNELDLTQVPGLQELYCDNNQLTRLDLTPVPGLQKLHCWGNQLTELDLTPVPGLQKLYCGNNQLTELDLTPVPELQELWCDDSLNITGAPPNLKVYC